MGVFGLCETEPARQGDRRNDAPIQRSDQVLMACIRGITPKILIIRLML